MNVRGFPIPVVAEIAAKTQRNAHRIGIVEKLFGPWKIRKIDTGNISGDRIEWRSGRHGESIGNGQKLGKAFVLRYLNVAKRDQLFAHEFVVDADADGLRVLLQEQRLKLRDIERCRDAGGVRGNISAIGDQRGHVGRSGCRSQWTTGCVKSWCQDSRRRAADRPRCHRDATGIEQERAGKTSITLIQGIGM